MEFVEKKRINEKKLKEMKKIGLIFENSNRKLLIKNKMEKKLLSDCDKKNIYINYSYINIRNKSNFNNRFVVRPQSIIHLNFRVLFRLLILYFFTFINYSSVQCIFNKINLLLKSSEITLKTKGTGNIKIISNSFFLNYRPTSIYINNVLKTSITNTYNLGYYNNDDINTIRIIWNSNPTSTISMFSGCNNIIEMDLSKFDTSNVDIVTDMFLGCSSLTSINLSNIKTSRVTSMAEMFKDCSKLGSLDLSEFDTSNVNNMVNMFKGCTNLEFINFK